MVSDSASHPFSVVCQVHRNRSHLVCRLALAVRSALPVVLGDLSAVPAPDVLPVHLVLPVVLGGLSVVPAPDALPVHLALPVVLDGLSAVPAPDALPARLVLPAVLDGLPVAPAPGVLAVRLHRLVLFLYFYSDYCYHYFPAF